MRIILFRSIINSLPLRIVLIVPFVLQIVGTVGLVGYLSFKNGQKAVNSLANQLMEETGARIAENLDNYLNIPENIDYSNVAALRLGILNPNNLDKIQDFFLQQMQIFDQASAVMITTENKDFLVIERSYEATQTIKSTTKGNATAIIALTASVLEEEKAIILSAGCDDFIRKPFREAIIFETMKKHLGIEYIYEEKSDNNIPEKLPDLTVEDLQKMPQEWIKNLYDATQALDDARMLELIKEIPPSHSLLRKNLTDLVNDFQFKIIRKIIESFAQKKN